MQARTPVLEVALALAIGGAVGYLLRDLQKTADAISNKSKEAQAPEASKTPEAKKENDAEEVDDDSDEYETEEEEEIEEGEEVASSTWTAAQLREEHKMVMVVRMDLKMGSGKVAAQCCHACLGAFKKAERTHPIFLKNWSERCGQAKIVVKSPSLEEIELAQAVAKSLSIPSYLVHDAGRTQIPAGSATVLAVGPAPASLVDKVTGNFRLY